MTSSPGGFSHDRAFVDEVATLLGSGSAENAEIHNRLVTLLYPELHRLAKHHMRAEPAGHTLQTTALVHEFFLEIARDQQKVWANRSHFLAAASQAMRRLLIDHARRRKSFKRGGGAIRIEFNADVFPETFEHARLLEFDNVLERLAAEQPRMAQVVEMRIFGGLTGQEIGEALGVDERTIKRDWRLAKAWLASQLRKG